MNEIDVTGQMEEFYRLESVAFEAYAENVYSKRVPRPIMPSTSFWVLVGVEAFLYFVAGVSAMFFSAIRTGGFFYIIESLLLKKYEFIADVFKSGIAWAVMLATLLTFEGYMAADGFSEGKNATEIKQSKLGMWTASIVIGLAGLFSSAGLADGIISEAGLGWFNLIVAIVTAIAGVVIVFVGGKNVGYTFLRYERKKKEIEKEFIEADATWNESAMRSFKSSSHGKKFYAMFKNGTLLQKSSPDENSDGEEYVLRPEDIELKPVRDITKSKKNWIKNQLNVYWNDNLRVPSYREIMDVAIEINYNSKVNKGELSASDTFENFASNFENKNKGTVSTARKEWIAENNLDDFAE